MLFRSMFCWQARTGFADLIAGTPADPPAELRTLEQHLQGCASCRAEVDSLRRVSLLVAETAISGAPAHPDTDEFANRILREGRARAASIQSRPIPNAMFHMRRPLPLAAALCLMVAAVTLTHFTGGVALEGRVPAAVAAASAPIINDGNDAIEDGVVPPREIPFVVREDLVGARRGSIPLTTYVLEPAPVEKPVMRASL